MRYLILAESFRKSHDDLNQAQSMYDEMLKQGYINMQLFDLQNEKVTAPVIIREDKNI